MRAAFFATIIGWLVGSLIPVALARTPLKVNPAPPAKYEDLEKYLEEDGSDPNNIPQYLEEAQCGGWDERSASGTIAKVTGVPGRSGVWNGAILTGMATRKDENGDRNIDNDFGFPPNTVGLTTVCSPDKTQIGKKIWKEKANGLPGEIEQVDVTYPHPKFTDPSCRWRRKNPDGSFTDVAPSFPLKELDEYDPPPDYGELDQEPDDRQSPPNCMNFCKMLNDYQFNDCLETDKATIPGDPPIEYTICKRWGHRYLCSDQEVKNASEACTTNTGDKANSIQCVGEECRCQGDGGPNPGNRCVANPGTKQEESPVYYSYVRTYLGRYTREKVVTDDGSDDVAADDSIVACYGFYNEFDPKTHFTGIDPATGISKDRRCVIDFDRNGETPIVERRDTQELKGEYGQNSSLPDRDPNEDENQRTPPGNDREAGDYDDEEDLWYLKLGGGFSLLNENVFSGSYSNDLTKVFLNINAMDTGKIRATEQLDVRRPFASGSYIRAFDDTGERAVTSWWQTQQNAIASVMHPPIIRLILPSGWAMGIDPDDPFFANEKVKILTPAAKHDERIEIQIDAKDDTLGAALAYLKRSLLLHVVEEPVPVIIPVGSATEFRAKAEAWCIWFMRKNDVSNCDDVPTDLEELMNTLETYATDIDQYRLVRAELATYAAKVLDIQQSVTKPISDWMVQNIDAYQGYLESQKLIQMGLGAEWRKAQEAYEKFGSITNMPWCMNQRFTMPVFSLLDDWLKDRETNGDRTAYKLPQITTTANADIVIDLSTVAFMSGTIVLPVLDPVQVRVTDIPSPPAVNEEKFIPEYPELPSIDAIHDALVRSMDSLPKPNSNTGSIAPINLKPVNVAEIERQKNTIVEIKNTIGKMDERYKKFWMSIGPFKENDPDPEFDINNKRGIAYKKPRLECLTWDDSTCQHVEMDLLERFMRIASRPLVFLKEDYGSKDTARWIGGPCIGQLDVCSPLHPEEGGENHLWEIFGPKNIAQPLEELRTDVRKATLPKPVGDVEPEDYPRYGTDTGTLLPSFDVPRAIELFVPRSSRSSSSSSRAP